MSVRNHSQSLQNDSGKLNLIVRDEGTANIYSNTKTLRFEPVGCIEYGPGSREVTINTASISGLAPGGDVVWKKGGVDSSIIPKFATVPNTATVDNAVAHGSGNNAKGLNSYAGGGDGNTVNTDATNSVVLGGTGNNVASSIVNTAVVGGGGSGAITGNRSDSLFIGTGGITRASTGTVWEDGNCGNSSQLWFTPSDFLGYDMALAAPTATAITDTGAAIWAQIGGGRALRGPGLYDNGEEVQLVAIKVLPKGFSTVLPVPAIGATFYFAGVPAWSSGVEVYETDLSANSYTILGSATPTAATQDVSFASSVSGSGPTAIMVVINQAGLINANEALLGVSVNIARI